MDTKEQPDGHTKGLVHSGPQEACVPTAKADDPAAPVINGPWKVSQSIEGDFLAVYPDTDRPEFPVCVKPNFMRDDVWAAIAQRIAALSSVLSWDEFGDEISDAISDSFDMDWGASDGARAVVRWLDENAPHGVVAAQNKADRDELLEALCQARDALHQHYVDWDGEPEIFLMLNALPDLIAAARERDGLREQARLDGEALKAADVALANVTAFEDDARYIMGNTNFEITKHCRDEIKARLEARQALQAGEKG